MQVTSILVGNETFRADQIATLFGGRAGNISLDVTGC